MSPSRALALAAAFGLVAGLTGCAGTVSLEPAARANDPACAEVVVRLPDTVGGEPRRWTDAQATGAWGDPASVLLTCGLDDPGPSTLRCIAVGGVDWLVDDSEPPHYRLLTFGRSPAVEVYVDNDVVSPNDVLDDLRLAVSQIPATRACTDPESPVTEQDDAG